MPRSSPIFQDHHGFEQQTLRYSRILRVLSDSDRFDIDAPENRIFMPHDKGLAQAMGVSPHSGGPIRDYQVGLLDNLRRLEQSKDGRAALAGDPEALDRVAARVNHLRDTVKVGLVNGDLHTNASLGQTANDARVKTQAFFGGARGYADTYANQVDALGKLGAVEHGWVGVTHNESRVIATLNHFNGSGQALTRGGNIELQRHGLSVAISEAYHGGKLTLSPGGVAVIENTLGEEAARPLRVPRGQSGAASMEVLLGNASASTLVRSGACWRLAQMRC